MWGINENGALNKRGSDVNDDFGVGKEGQIGGGVNKMNGGNEIGRREKTLHRTG